MLRAALRFRLVAQWLAPGSAPPRPGECLVPKGPGVDRAAGLSLTLGFSLLSADWTAEERLPSPMRMRLPPTRVQRERGAGEGEGPETRTLEPAGGRNRTGAAGSRCRHAVPGEGEQVREQARRAQTPPWPPLFQGRKEEEEISPEIEPSGSAQRAQPQCGRGGEEGSPGLLTPWGYFEEQGSQAPPVREGALWPSACLPNSPRLQLQALSKSFRKPLHPAVPRLSWIEIRARKLLLSQQRLAGRMEEGRWRSGARTWRVGRDWLPGQGLVVAGHAKWDSLDNSGLRTVARQGTRG
ncbi:unnamed protein product [Rangifer tarandus platyrhynchus]|uniref:Uncharacterized protein n=2 Tax=Rangifer tarandus platyrhynchus TaxID=3082113 RepID=A0ACB0E372_RANTA|nr:unnamed protein product [Rangifer tarandus platyrhynchus]CAI9694879.1 unnamed protein product [Rangifer tarandus platyrhynchus]